MAELGYRVMFGIFIFLDPMTFFFPFDLCNDCFRHAFLAHLKTRVEYVSFWSNYTCCKMKLLLVVHIGTKFLASLNHLYYDIKGHVSCL